MNKKISRRAFLKLAVTTLAGLALTACGINATNSPEPTKTAIITPSLTSTLTTTITNTPEPTATITHTPGPTETPAPTATATLEPKIFSELKFADTQFNLLGVDPQDYQLTIVDGVVVGEDLKTATEVYKDGRFVLDYVVKSLKGKLFPTDITGIKNGPIPYYPTPAVFQYTNGFLLRVWETSEFPPKAEIPSETPMMLDPASKSWGVVLYDQSHMSKYVVFETKDQEVRWVSIQPLKAVEIISFHNKK